MSAIVAVKLLLGASFLDELRPFALINGYCECLEHAHQFISVNMAVSSCQVVLASCVSQWRNWARACARASRDNSIIFIIHKYFFND